ncbi:MAG: hypothetical protein A3A86_00400 [Elusimicrobia bacterium RIFCSPLOWO2_01_FULL_60_11]|nr:MAG: hypothetical protein A3A86_00400 [Elusimicrobia bacterium RIFCSPLOWO2_01_FULL_60_11]
MNRSAAVFLAALAVVAGLIGAVAIERRAAGQDVLAFERPRLPTASLVAGNLSAAVKGFRPGHRRAAAGWAIFAGMALFFFSSGKLALDLIFPPGSAREGPDGALLLGFSYLLGALIASLLWFVYGLLGVINATSAMGTFALGAVLAVIAFRRASWKIPPLSLPAKIGITLIGLYFLFVSCNAFVFQDYADVFQIDFTLPMHFIYDKSVAPNPFETYSYYPQNWWILLTWPLVLKSEMASVLLLWSYYTAFTLLVWGLTRRYASPRAAAASVLLFLTGLILTHLSIFMKSDLSVGLFIFAHYCALIPALNMAEDDEASAGRWVLLAGLLCGGAVGHKLTALFAAFTSTAILLFNGRGKSLVLWWFLGLALTTFPWFLRSYLATGNPIYPYLNSLFGAKLAAFWHVGTRLNGPDTIGWDGVVRYLGLLFGRGRTPDILPDVWGPGAGFAVLCLFLWRKKTPSGQRWVVAGALASMAALLTYSMEWRYYIGYLAVVLCVPFALFLEAALESPKSKWIYPLTVTVLIVAFHQTILQSDFWKRSCHAFRAVLFGFSPGNYAGANAEMDQLRWISRLINGNTDPGDAVLYAGIDIHYGLERKISSNSATDRETIVVAAERSKDAAELARNLREMGIRQILVKPSVLESLLYLDIPVLSYPKSELDKIDSMLAQDAVLRAKTPDGSILWYSLKGGGEFPPVAVTKDDVEYHPVMALAHAAALAKEGKGREAGEIWAMARDARIIPALKLEAKEMTVSE